MRAFKAIVDVALTVIAAAAMAVGMSAGDPLLFAGGVFAFGVACFTWPEART